MTAKSETVGVESVWLRKIDGGTGNEAWFVCNLIDPGGVEFVPASALAELKDQAITDIAGKLKAELAQRKAERQLQSLLSGLEALAGEWKVMAAEFNTPLLHDCANELRALIPAAANTESEETNHE